MPAGKDGRVRPQEKLCANSSQIRLPTDGGER